MGSSKAKRRRRRRKERDLERQINAQYRRHVRDAPPTLPVPTHPAKDALPTAPASRPSDDFLELLLEHLPALETGPTASLVLSFTFTTLALAWVAAFGHLLDAPGADPPVLPALLVVPLFALTLRRTLARGLEQLLKGSLGGTLAALAILPVAGMVGMHWVQPSLEATDPMLVVLAALAVGAAPVVAGLTGAWSAARRAPATAAPPELAPAEEIRFLPATTPHADLPAPEADPCQFCGSSLSEGAVVRCRRCDTPHHQDCWEAAGACTTFGCGSRRHH